MVHLKLQSVYTFRAICRDEGLRGSAATAKHRAAADAVGAHTAADLVFRLQDRHARAGVLQRLGGHETREAGADDDADSIVGGMSGAALRGATGEGAQRREAAVYAEYLARHPGIGGL